MQCKLVSVFTLASVWPFYFGPGRRGFRVFERERGAACALIYYLFFTIDPSDNESSGEDLQQVPIDELNQDFDIDVTSEMENDQ